MHGKLREEKGARRDAWRSAEEKHTHVGLTVSGHDGGSKHLCELLDVGLEAGDGVDDADEGEHDCEGWKRAQSGKGVGQRLRRRPTFRPAADGPCRMQAESALTGSEDDGDDERPPRELRVAGVARRHCHREGDEDDTAVNVHRHLLVDEHLLVVRVVDLASLELADGIQDRAPVPAVNRRAEGKKRPGQLNGRLMPIQVHNVAVPRAAYSA